MGFKKILPYLLGIPLIVASSGLYFGNENEKNNLKDILAREHLWGMQMMRERDSLKNILSQSEVGELTKKVSNLEKVSTLKDSIIYNYELQIEQYEIIRKNCEEAINQMKNSNEYIHKLIHTKN